MLLFGGVGGRLCVDFFARFFPDCQVLVLDFFSDVPDGVLGSKGRGRFVLRTEIIRCGVGDLRPLLQLRFWRLVYAVFRFFLSAGFVRCGLSFFNVRVLCDLVHVHGTHCRC